MVHSDGVLIIPGYWVAVFSGEVAAVSTGVPIYRVRFNTAV